MGVVTAPYSDASAMVVFRGLDPNDQIEAGLVRGKGTSHLGLFGDWRAVQAGAVLSLVLKTARFGAPFAVLALGNTGQAGVAQAALLARNHQRFAIPLARAALTIRRDMPGFCQDVGIHRIEARCWRDHPSAARFLRACGFHLETDLPGFGRTGQTTFQQFAWITPKMNGD